MKSLEVRRNEALARNARWASKSLEEQRRYLDEAGFAATRQRARIGAKMLPQAAVAGGLLNGQPSGSGKFGADPAAPMVKRPRHKKGRRLLENLNHEHLSNVEPPL